MRDWRWRLKKEKYNPDQWGQANGFRPLADTLRRMIQRLRVGSKTRQWFNGMALAWRLCLTGQIERYREARSLRSARAHFLIERWPPSWRGMRACAGPTLRAGEAGARFIFGLVNFTGLGALDGINGWLRHNSTTRP